MSETTESSSSFEMLHDVVTADEENSFVSNGSSRSIGDGGGSPSSISGNSSSSASTSTQDFAIIRSPPFASTAAATLTHDSQGQGSGVVDVTTEISEATFSLDDEEAAMMYARADTEKTSNVIHHSKSDDDSIEAALDVVVVADEEEDLDTQLALRTSQLMSSYLDYVKEIDNRDSTSNAVSVDYAPPSPPPLIVAADHQGGSAATPATPSDYPRINSNNNNNIDYSAPQVMSSQYPTVQTHRIKYTHPIFHSRKFKRSLCMLAIVGCVVVGMVVVTSVTKKEVMQQRSPTTTTPTTEDAAGISFIKKKEEEGFHWEVGPLHHYQQEGEDESGGSFNKDYGKIVAFSTGPIITGSVSSSSLSSSSSQGGGGEVSNNHQQQIGNILHQQFKPLWFSTQDGWNGGSHADAIEFCQSFRNRNLCPYAVICPNGDGSDAIVMPGHSYGHKSEFIVDGEQYAPVYGSGNNWVLIGEKEQQSSVTTSSSTTNNKCKTTLQLDGTANPYWGWSSERADMKKHIMCCKFD